ncbi:MAG: DUF4136 domain-containing protein [Polyangiaceae bacterium]
MAFRWRPFLLFLTLGTVFCAPTVSIHSAKSPTARFADYRTFAFDSTEGVPPSARSRSAEVGRRVRQQVAQLLESKGYVQAADSRPDLLIRVAAGRREREISHPHPAPRWLEEDEEDDFIEGAFVIDVLDSATQELVWHGSARAEVEPDRIDDQRLRRAVTSVMATFPFRTADFPR